MTSHDSCQRVRYIDCLLFCTLQWVCKMYSCVASAQLLYSCLLQRLPAGRSGVAFRWHWEFERVL